MSELLDRLGNFRRSLVIRKWEPADPSVKILSVIRVLFDRTEIEDPIVLPVSMVQKFLDVLSTISVKAFYSRCRISHDYDLISQINEIFRAVLVATTKYSC